MHSQQAQDLPIFRYHPDPLVTGSIIESDSVCICCERSIGYIYVGPAYAEDEYIDCFCPLCIANGRAATQFDVEFHDPDVTGWVMNQFPADPRIIDEVVKRTPGFSGWQQEQWWTHCSDAAAYLGQASRDDLDGRWVSALPAIRVTTPDINEKDWHEILDSCRNDRGASMYIFQCLHCGVLGGYWDSD